MVPLPFSSGLESLYGLVTCQVGDIKTLLEIPDDKNTKRTVKQFIKDNYDYKNDFLPVVGVVHLVWIGVFFFVVTYCIK